MALTERKSKLGPQTDDELHAWIQDRLGINIPRVAVCETHQSPFQFLSDIYFERSNSAIAMANRGGSKTYIAALWLFLCCKFNPKCEAASVASESQTQRAYGHLKDILCVDGDVPDVSKHDEIEKSVMRETVWKNKSKYEIIIATVAGVNGPHPHKVHADEIEIMDEEPFNESRHMSSTHGGIKAQDVLTSTRKGAHGPMQKLIDECKEAERQGREPSYKVYTWCFAECAERVPNCQVANPDLPLEQRCNCDRVQKGYWESGNPRIFKDICQGRLARSDGWIPLDDIQKRFRNTDKFTWEAQQECSRPSTEGIVLPEFDRYNHGIKWWMPDPSFGKLYMGIDFGFTNPHAVEWVQVLNKDVYAYGPHQTKDEQPNKLIKAGTHVVFDEVYKSQIPTSTLGKLIGDHNRHWKMAFPDFRLQYIFYDVQGADARSELAKCDSGGATSSGKLIATNFATKDVKLHVAYLRELTEDRTLQIDIQRCPMLVDELEAWHFPDKKSYAIDDPEKPVPDFDHGISAIRYTVSNIRRLNLKGESIVGTGHSQKGYGKPSITGAGPSRYLPKNELTRSKYHEMI